MFENKSSSFSFSTYDWWGAGRGIFFFLIAGLVVNIEPFKVFLSDVGVGTFASTMIVWGVLDLGRRFLKDYTTE